MKKDKDKKIINNSIYGIPTLSAIQKSGSSDNTKFYGELSHPDTPLDLINTSATCNSEDGPTTAKLDDYGYRKIGLYDTETLVTEDIYDILDATYTKRKKYKETVLRDLYQPHTLSDVMKSWRKYIEEEEEEIIIDTDFEIPTGLE